MAAAETSPEPLKRFQAAYPDAKAYDDFRQLPDDGEAPFKDWHGE